MSMLLAFALLVSLTPSSGDWSDRIQSRQERQAARMRLRSKEDLYVAALGAAD